MSDNKRSRPATEPSFKEAPTNQLVSPSTEIIKRAVTGLDDLNTELRVMLEQSAALRRYLAAFLASQSAPTVTAELIIAELWNTITASKHMSPALSRADHHILQSIARRMVMPNLNECSISMKIFDPSLNIQSTHVLTCRACYPQFTGDLSETQLCLPCYHRVSDVRTIIRLMIKSHSIELSPDEESALFNSVNRVGAWQTVLYVQLSTPQ